MTTEQPNQKDEAKFVLRRVAVRRSFHRKFAPPGVAEFIDLTVYEHKSLLMNTMSGMFDFQIPSQRPEWWIVQLHDGSIKGLALVSYSQLNLEGPQEYVGVEHLLVSEDFQNKGIGRLILTNLQKLARKHSLGGVNLESEEALESYYARFGFVRRKFQPPGAFVKLIWKR